MLDFLGLLCVIAMMAMAVSFGLMLGVTYFKALNSFSDYIADKLHKLTGKQ